MKQYKGAIFDLDGTLLDSMRVWDDIDVAFLKKRGLEVPPDYQEAITPLGFLEAARYTIRRFGFPETPEELIQEWHQMAVDAYTYEVELKDGAAEYLRYLKEKGIRMAVATSSSPELYEPALKRNGIYEYFKAFVTVSEVKRGKGFPDIYEKAAEKLSLPPETCVVYEDILTGIRGAKMGGFAAVGVYDRGGEGNRAKMEQEADRYVTSFKELMNGGDSFF